MVGDDPTWTSGVLLLSSWLQIQFQNTWAVFTVFMWSMTTTQLPMPGKPYSLEAVFPKTGFSSDHPPKALFTTSAYKETQHFDRHSLANPAEWYKAWFEMWFLSFLMLKFDKCEGSWSTVVTWSLCVSLNNAMDWKPLCHQRWHLGA